MAWQYQPPPDLQAAPDQLLACAWPQINCHALSIIGPHLEMVAGGRRTAAVYVVAGITGSLASYVMTPAPSVGASGARACVCVCSCAQAFVHACALTHAHKGFNCALVCSVEAFVQLMLFRGLHGDLCAGLICAQPACARRGDAISIMGDHTPLTQGNDACLISCSWTSARPPQVLLGQYCRAQPKPCSLKPAAARLHKSRPSDCLLSTVCAALPFALCPHECSIALPSALACPSMADASKHTQTLTPPLTLYSAQSRPANLATAHLRSHDEPATIDGTPALPQVPCLGWGLPLPCSTGATSTCSRGTVRRCCAAWASRSPSIWGTRCLSRT